jgi:anti-anti-sigma regulatory factor
MGQVFDIHARPKGQVVRAGGAPLNTAMTNRAQVEVRDSGDGPVAMVMRGSADVAAAGSVRQAMVLAMTPGSDIVVHVDELSRLDGAGLQLLFAAKRQTERHGRTFTLIVGDGDGPARRAIETAGAHELLEGENTCRK